MGKGSRKCKRDCVEPHSRFWLHFRLDPVKYRMGGAEAVVPAHLEFSRMCQIADAVLGTGGILRTEPEIKWIPHFDHLLDYRESVLGKPRSVRTSGCVFVLIVHPDIR